MRGIKAIRTQQHGAAATLTNADHAGIEATLEDEMRRNTFDESHGTITVSAERAQAHHWACACHGSRRR